MKIFKDLGDRFVNQERRVVSRESLEAGTFIVTAVDLRADKYDRVRVLGHWSYQYASEICYFVELCDLEVIDFKEAGVRYEAKMVENF